MAIRSRGLRLALSAGVALTLAISMLSIGRTASASGPTTINLRTADAFAILAGTGITNTGATTIKGDVGSFPNPAMTGFASVVQTGTNHGGDPVTQGAKTDLVQAYNDAFAAGPVTANYGTLGGRNLVGGVYNANGVILDLTGTLTLNGQNDPSSVWVFQATSALIAAVGSEVKLENGANPCNVFWQVTSDATLNTGSKFVGTILSMQSVWIRAGVQLNGRALARNADVTLDSDTIAVPTCSGGGAGAGASVTTYDTICINNVLIQRTFLNGVAVAQTALAGPCGPGPIFYTATSTPTIAAATPSVAAATPSVAPGTATPAPSVAPTAAPSETPVVASIPFGALPFTATEDNTLMFLILPLVIIAFAVLYMVARARRRRAAPPVV